MEKNDLEAIKLLKEWCTWLVAIETGVIAAIGTIDKQVIFSSRVYDGARILAGITIVVLAYSIFIAIHMLLALPAMVQRLPPPADKDIYSLTNPASHRELVTFVKQLRWSSIIGLFGFALLMIVVVVFQKHAS